MAKMANPLEGPTMRVSATEAKNRFGSLSAQAKREPVFVEKAGQLDTVILSAEHYHALQANHDKTSRASRKKRFEAEFGDWIAAQNARLEAHGIPGEDLRPW
jgi:PHD/YefM family antitoxin component YafN of YafNO toxin-antitoxin module